jgi:hypothetical protein
VEETAVVFFADELGDDGGFRFAEAGCLSCFSCIKQVEPLTDCPGCSTPWMETVFMLQTVHVHITEGIVE